MTWHPVSSPTLRATTLFLAAHTAEKEDDMPASNVDYALRRQTEAAKKLVADLRGEDDADLVADAIEGETDLIEAITIALDEIDECEVLETGLKAKEDAFKARRYAIAQRRERRKALIEQAMVATEQTTIRLPSATLTLARRAPKPLISSEPDIPARFWVEQERPAPKLDDRLLAEALKAGEVVAGASLDNGSVSLSVRRK